MIFDTAFDVLMTHEGHYSNHPADTGGETCYGITEVVARANGYVGDMREMPLDFAKQVYKKRYWDNVQCDAMPDPLRYPLFDAAVNSGEVQAIKWLQSAIGVKVDGKLGPVTRHAANTMPVQATRQRMIGARLRFMTERANWSSFSKGWSRRIAALLEM